MDSLRNLGFYFLNEVLAFENLPTVLPTELKNIHVIELFSLMKENNKVVKWITSTLKTTTKQEDVNEDTLITNIYRLISNKKKRGDSNGQILETADFPSQLPQFIVPISAPLQSLPLLSLVVHVVINQ